jgi:hypothetical protein
MKKDPYQKWKKYMKKLHRIRRLIKKRSRGQWCKRINCRRRQLITILKEGRDFVCITHPQILNKVIENLTSLNLATYPREAIIKELHTIRTLPFMVKEQHTMIDRAVLNTPEEPEFHTASRISYAPPEKNTQYRRASTPDNTIFYGAILPTNASMESRMTAAAETSELIRNPHTTKTEEHITFGKWALKKPLKLVTIIDPNKKYKTKEFNDVAEKYKKHIDKCPKEIAQGFYKALAFFSNEFAKEVKDGEDYNYMISALLTEELTKHRCDGVLYPSVQGVADGLCVAISPEVVDNNLELIRVFQYKITRQGDKATMVCEKSCVVEPPNSDFQLEDCPMHNK